MLASEAFGKKLRELRIAQGLTQQQLAEQVYVSRYTVSNWEGGKRLPDVSTISRLARCLKVEDRVLYESMREQENAPNIVVVEDVPVILRNFVHTLSRELPKAQVWGFANFSDQPCGIHGECLCAALQRVSDETADPGENPQ